MSVIVTNINVSEVEVSKENVVVDKIEEASQLTDCAGKCGQKILIFSHDVDEDWSGCVDRMFCLECRSKMLSPPHLK